MNKKYTKSFAIALACLAMCGCASQNATYVEAGGARSIISTDKINIADWNKASADLTNQLIASGAIDKYGLPMPVKMKVSRIVNRTSNPIDTDMLTKQICIALNNTGKIATVSDDPRTQELAQYQAKRMGATLGLEKFTMTGKIIEDRESNDDMREVTYVFMLELNYLGKAIWMGQTQIGKQSEKGLFGL